MRILVTFITIFRLEDGEYMGFGLSGDNDRSKMVGGDVTVAWMDHESGRFIKHTFMMASSILKILRIC